MRRLDHESRHVLFGAPRSVRREAGLAHRKQVPLEAHAEVPKPDQRPDAVGILCAQDGARQQDLVPIRHGRMSATPFTFYRGGAAIMASDLSMTPTTDLAVQLCGDAHLSNFGIFNGPDRRLVFDLNDFDETLPGPFEWDLKRLAASITIAGRNNEHAAKKIARSTRAAVQGYRETMARASTLSPLDLHYFRLEIDEIATRINTKDGKGAKRTKKALTKASKKNSLRAFNKLTHVVDGQPKIIADPPLITPIEDHEVNIEISDLREFFREYVDTLPRELRRLLERYEVMDMAQKVVGVGSVGTSCWIVLLTSGDEEPLFIQIKQATASVLEPYCGESRFEQAGERVVEGQQVLQAAGDIFLGWSRSTLTGRASRDFYLRQLWDGKGSAEVDDMGPGRLRRYAWFCGAALALGHARSADPALISGYVGEDEVLDHALAVFGEGYADLNDLDHTAHQAAIDSGELPVIQDI